MMPDLSDHEGLYTINKGFISWVCGIGFRDSYDSCAVFSPILVKFLST